MAARIADGAAAVRAGLVPTIHVFAWDLRAMLSPMASPDNQGARRGCTAQGRV